MLLTEHQGVYTESVLDYIYKILNSSPNYNILKENFLLVEESIWRPGNLVLSEAEQSRAERAAEQYIKDTREKLEELKGKKKGQVKRANVFGMISVGIGILGLILLGSIPLAISMVLLLSQLFTLYIACMEEKNIKETNSELKRLRSKLVSFSFKVRNDELHDKLGDLLERVDYVLDDENFRGRVYS